MPNASDLATPTPTAAAAGRPDDSAGERFDRRLGLAKAGLGVVAVVLALMVPWLAPDAFILSVAVVIASYAAFAVGWNFVGGFTGYISLGHASYSGLGGYAVALLTTHTGINPWVALVLGAVAVALLAVPIGIASLRVRGASFVIVSIALVLILLLVFQSWASVTGGSEGLRVPRPFDNSVLRPEQHTRFYFLFLVLIGIALLVWWLIDRSQFGAGLKAIREDEDKAEALGVPTFRYKLVVFVISAFFTSLAGGLYALWFGNLDPVFQFSILTGSYMVLMSLFGGIRSLVGPVVGAVVVGYAMEVFKAQYGDSQFHLVALGLLLAVVVLFMPEGVVPALLGLVHRLRPAATSIREESAAQLLERNKAIDAERRAQSETEAEREPVEDVHHASTGKGRS
ncbi:branched-chain amino acid ABC transporter permease [Serinicoccus chungangensis]|uniref:branched-chain amino acid ABC transporter permease n=1 Tax=Serinicoccus chungangensis TaxID=767452 RepID=UPI000A5F3966|nr:branched-chain amino acid ABC transporter permease [Serinicoccus chungangensis]